MSTGAAERPCIGRLQANDLESNDSANCGAMIHLMSESDLDPDLDGELPEDTNLTPEQFEERRPDSDPYVDMRFLRLTVVDGRRTVAGLRLARAAAVAPERNVAASGVCVRWCWPPVNAARAERRAGRVEDAAGVRSPV